MDVGLLGKVFGADRTWQKECTVILDAGASVQTFGVDSIVHGGQKNFAPRLVSGRIHADAVCLLADHSALLVFQQHRTRQQTGEEVIRQTLLMVDAAHVVGVEFTNLAPLAELGVAEPTVHHDGSFPPGALVG